MRQRILALVDAEVAGLAMADVASAAAGAGIEVPFMQPYPPYH